MSSCVNGKQIGVVFLFAAFLTIGLKNNQKLNRRCIVITNKPNRQVSNLTGIDTVVDYWALLTIRFKQEKRESEIKECRIMKGRRFLRNECPEIGKILNYRGGPAFRPFSLCVDYVMLWLGGYRCSSCIMSLIWHDGFLKTKVLSREGGRDIFKVTAIVQHSQTIILYGIMTLLLRFKFSTTLLSSFYCFPLIVGLD